MAHQTSGRTLLGLSLALSTAVLWAILPVALKFALEQTDPLTLTWFRFATACFALLGWLAARGGFAQFAKLDRRSLGLLFLAVLALNGNYLFYLLGLQRTTPGNTQLLMQIAPLLLAAGGVVFFRERLDRRRLLSTSILLGGLALFFLDQQRTAGEEARSYLEGSSLVLLAAATWAAYALAQKELLIRLSSTGVLLLVFAFGTVWLLPFVDFASLGSADSAHWLAITFCCVNTLAAYGAFAQALVHAEASRISVVLAVNPLLTLVVVALAHGWLPARFPPVQVAALGYLGALLAVAGSVASAWLSQSHQRSLPADLRGARLSFQGHQESSTCPVRNSEDVGKWP